MKINYKIKPPKPGNILYRSIFKNDDDSTIIKLISDGLISVLINASRLINDVELLVYHEKYSSARFLLTTADEEIAKSYILLDMCRLDFKKYESVLRSLCKAFYDHVFKHAYNEIHRFGRIHDLNHAREIWEVEITKWWPNNDIESGEPDMPHDTYFSREMPLYVDYIDYDQMWSVPSNERESFYFKSTIGIDSLAKSKKYLDRLQWSYKCGFYHPNILSIFHSEFKKYYIKNDFDRERLIKIYKKINKIITKKFPDKKGKIFSTNLFAWPIYHFLIW